MTHLSTSQKRRAGREFASIRYALAALALCLATLGLLAGSACAAPTPSWDLNLSVYPTNIAPGPGDRAHGPNYYLFATNVGGAPTSEPFTFTDTFPAGITPVDTYDNTHVHDGISCNIAGQTVTCTDSALLQPGHVVMFEVVVDDSLAEGSTATDTATLSGGGALPAQVTTTTAITSQPSPFDFLPAAAGLAASLTGPDGLLASQAGSHPYQFDVNLGIPGVRGNNAGGGGNIVTPDGGARDIDTDLPPGTIVNPTTPVRCTEAQLETEGCPAESQVGVIVIRAGLVGGVSPYMQPLYNMVPPPGHAASFAFNAVAQGIFIHILGGLRAGDYALAALAENTLALSLHPVFGVQVQLWGDPSDSSHDYSRSFECLSSPGSEGAASCVPSSLPPQDTPQLSTPTSCQGIPEIEASIDSWGHPGDFLSRSAALADQEGNEESFSGCNALQLPATLLARPTTNLADSPSGLDVDLHIPQSEGFATTATAHLKKATVTLPEGLVVNPSQADGLAACSSVQIGIDPATGIANGAEPSCPDAAKIGTVEVDSPLLAEYDEENKIELDPETGHVIPDPLPGAVYIAKPFDNPFDSLLAIYLVIDDPQSGIVVKLAGNVEADPQSGRLTTTFDRNPQLPFEDFKLHVFGGARGALITPPTCGTHTTASTLIPWSSPEGVDVHPSDSFQTTAEPGGGACPSSEGAAANHPAFQAGTLAPQAGAFSPFVLKLSREDGSQRIAGIDTLLPPGLTGKLAGIPECSDAQIAQAKSREKPNLGALEKANPSCPASTQVGALDIAAGAGPTPFHTQGKVYLAGSYKGGPWSLAVIVPALAGPFDLGAVVSRVALYINPETAQIHAVSDPLPQILDGIPLDVRSIALKMDRPEFTLNPTSCDPMSIAGSALSALGQSAALSNPFQVGGCPQLPFKPKLSLRLKGGTRRASHPKLIASLKAKPGEANVASAQVKLPPSAFLDQAHIRTVCTRVQFAANACPQGSIYGTAEATTPLLDYPISGNVYLRSSNHKLPDLVVALKGPASQPIEIDLDGKTDSVRGALRNTFEAVPDAPVSKFRLELFGGKRGLVINSRNLCAHTYKAEVNLTGQNGKVFDTEPAVGTDCKGKGRKGKGHSHGR